MKKSKERSSSIFKRKFLDIPLLEWIAVLAFFTALGLLLAKKAGGPLTSDELYYMDAGLNGIKDPMILFYYFHIYLQRVFMEIAPSPLAGAKFYWAFLISATGISIYLSTRLLSWRNHFLNASLAVALFLSLEFISRYSGVTKNDLTAMMLVAVFFFFYLVAQKRGFPRWTLVVLGFLFFLTFKTKETSILAGFVLLGSGFQEDDRFNSKILLKRLPFLLAGFLGGALVFIILNTLIVHDPLWGMRFSDLAAYFSQGVTGNALHWPAIKKNFFADEIFRSLMLLFLLFLFSGIQLHHQKLKIQQKLLYLYPFILVVFLTLIMIISSGFSVTDRFFFPAIPVLCVFGSRIFDFEEIIRSVKWKRLILYFIMGIAIGIAIQVLVLSTQSVTNYQLADIVNNVAAPILVSLLLASLIWLDAQGARKIVVPVMCLAAALYLPIYNNFDSIVIQQPITQRTGQIFYPFSAFSEKIDYSPEMKMYISSSINRDQLMLLRRVDEVRSIFNIYFKENSQISNFIYPIIYDKSKGVLIYQDPLETLPAMNYDYAIITAEDWERVKENNSLYSSLTSAYTIQFDDQQNIALLQRK